MRPYKFIDNERSRLGLCTSWLPALAIIVHFNSPVASQETRQQPAEMIYQKIRVLVDQEYDSLFELYRQLHANPELSFHEVKTAARIKHELEVAGFEVTGNVGGHGVVGVLKNGQGPTLMLRTDMDALPIVEETGLDYASRVRVIDEHGKIVGVMHACGHDIHMTCVAGTARLLNQLKSHWQGTLVVIGQPAEERGGGARAMLADGLFRRFPRPDYALAMHDDAGMESGNVGLTEGSALAGVDSVDLTIRGVGGHGAYPHTTKDPILLAAQTVLALQSIVSRELRAIDPAVISVGSIHGGTKHNIIPKQVKLEITVRYYSDAVRAQIHESIERIAKGIAIAGGVPADLAPIMKVSKAEPVFPVHNEPELSRRVIHSMEKMLGKDHVLELDPVMAGEDFGYYGRTEHKIPLCMFWVGTVGAERMQDSRREGGKPLPSLHASTFAPVPEPTIKTGVKAMTSAALDLLQPF